MKNTNNKNIPHPTTRINLVKSLFEDYKKKKFINWYKYIEADNLKKNLDLSDSDSDSDKDIEHNNQINFHKSSDDSINNYSGKGALFDFLQEMVYVGDKVQDSSELSHIPNIGLNKVNKQYSANVLALLNHQNDKIEKIDL